MLHADRNWPRHGRRPRDHQDRCRIRPRRKAGVDPVALQQMQPQWSDRAAVGRNRHQNGQGAATGWSERAHDRRSALGFHARGCRQDRRRLRAVAHAKHDAGRRRGREILLPLDLDQAAVRLQRRYQGAAQPALVGVDEGIAARERRHQEGDEDGSPGPHAPNPQSVISSRSAMQPAVVVRRAGAGYSMLPASGEQRHQSAP